MKNKIETPSEAYKKILKKHAKDFPNDPINEPMKSEFFKNKHFKKLIKK